MKEIGTASVRIIVISLLFLLLGAGWGLSQVPPDAGALLQQQQRTQPPELQRSPWGVLEKEPPQLEDTGKKLIVRGFRFSGNEGLAPDAQLNALLADAVGKEMGVDGLKKLADRVTQYLRRKGWFLARAYIPRQEIKDGLVEIAVLAGSIEGGAETR